MKSQKVSLVGRPLMGETRPPAPRRISLGCLEFTLKNKDIAIDGRMAQNDGRRCTSQKEVRGPQLGRSMRTLLQDRHDADPTCA